MQGTLRKMISLFFRLLPEKKKIKRCDLCELCEKPFWIFAAEDAA
jgi:hypothetical protein